MSKPRYDWWNHAKGMTRRYEQLKAEMSDLHSQSMTADYSGDVHGSGASRTTEMVAVRELPTNKMREYEAVRRAIEATERCKNGQDKLKIIKLMYWDETHLLKGAAFEIPVSYDTAKIWHRDFLRLVGAFYGYLD